MPFQLGSHSKSNLTGVHPDLIRVVCHAIDETDVDFRVTEGLRTLIRQKELVRLGASKTLNSKHIRQPDGFGHAVDLCAMVGGKVRWEFPLYFEIARAMQHAAKKLNVQIIWGSVWDKTLNNLSTNLQAEVEAYKKRHPGPDFLDGPHFQIKGA